MLAAIHEAIRTKSIFELEHRVRRVDGTLGWTFSRAVPLLDAKGEIVEWFGAASDVTERKQAEAALQESEARLRLSVEASNVGLWDWDLQTNDVYFSPEWKNQIGYRDDEISNRFDEWQSRVHPDDLEPSLRRVREFVENPQATYEVEFRLRHKNGSYRWIYTHANLFRGPDGKPVRMLGCHIDITGRKQAEEAMRALAARLEAVREEERAGLARELHDDLGATLTGLNMDLHWLRRKLPQAGEPAARAAFDDKIRAMTGIVDAATETVQHICVALRPAVLDDLGLAPALEWETRQFESRTGLRCDLSLPAGELALDGPRAIALFRVFQEILTNVARHARAKSVSIRLTRDNQRLVLCVRDDGRGVSAAEIAAPRSLGLLGMRERVAAFGGTVEITGQPGNGTTVTVRVPMGNE